MHDTPKQDQQPSRLVLVASQLRTSRACQRRPMNTTRAHDRDSRWMPSRTEGTQDEGVLTTSQPPSVASLRAAPESWRTRCPSSSEYAPRVRSERGRDSFVAQSAAPRLVTSSVWGPYPDSELAAPLVGPVTVPLLNRSGPQPGTSSARPPDGDRLAETDRTSSGTDDRTGSARAVQRRLHLRRARATMRARCWRRSRSSVSPVHALTS